MHEKTKLGIQLYRTQEESPTGEVLNLFQDAAETGCIEALYRTGVCHLMGIGTEKDEELALTFFREASEGDHLLARNNLAFILYFYPEGPKDPEVAVEHWLRAGSAGLASGLLNAGTAFMCGRKVTRDRERAFRLYQRAARLGHPYAMNALARCHLRGIGTERRVTKSWVMFGRAFAHMLGTMARGQFDPEGILLLDNHRSRPFWMGTLRTTLDDEIVERAQQSGMLPIKTS